MGIFSKLFGKKKPKTVKSEETVKSEAAKIDKIEEADSREISLEQVENELSSVSMGAPAKQQPMPPREPSDYEASEAKERVQKEAEMQAVKKDEESSKKEDDDKMYQIKKHKDGWQVVLAGATRATRVFKTQKEAIDFAKENDFDYQLFRADGTLRT